MATTQTFVTDSTNDIQSLGVASAAVEIPTSHLTQQITSSPEQHTADVVASLTNSSQGIPQSESPQPLNEGTIVTEETAQSTTSTDSSVTGTVVQSSIVQTTAGTPQFITVAVADNSDRSDQDQVVQEAVALQTGQAGALHPAYVQYVDQGTSSITDPASNIYAAANGQMTYSVYSVSEGGSMYTPASGSYYNATGATAVTHSQVGASMTTQTGSVLGSTASLQGQILTTAQGNAYVVQGITAAGTIDTDGNQLAHATRASPATDGTITYLVPGNAVSAPQTAVGAESCSDQVEGAIGSGSQSNMAAHATRVSPATVQWLLDNYETAEGVSLPRRTLYQHYCRHCSDNKLEPVNAASFGKLIRSVFLGLRTRRLGTRGNSKYHYYGLRVKPDSPLVNISEDHGSSALRQQPLSPHKRLKVCTTRIEQNGSTQSLTTQQSTTSVEPTSPTSTQISQLHQIQSNPQQQHHQQFLGDASAAVPLLMNVDISNNTLPEGITVEDIKTFVELYRDHCESFLDVVTNLQFSMVEMLWKSFWRYQGNEDLIDDLERRMSKSLLYSLCRFDPIQDFVKKTDYQFYQNLVDVLIPDVLRPIPSSLTQSIRNFAKSLESWLTTSMAKCPDDILKVKLSAVGAFAQTLRRYTSLNHLAQAARAVLQNSSQIHQMLADLNRVDFHNVQEQASWVCQCDDITVQKLEEDFKATLQQQNSLEQWAAWLEGVVNQVLRPHEGKVDFSKAARQFLLKWSFYSSMVIRDLTLRSAASFGSFHLIRLLYDEYMFYLVEHRVAEATGETPIAVMGENIGLATRRDSPDLKDRMSFSSSNCGLSLVTNNSVSFSHQLCNDRSTDSESSTSSTGRDPESLELPLKRMKPTI